MRMVDADAFLLDLQNEGCDIINADPRHYLYSEFGYSYELIERVIERQSMTQT